MRKRTNIKIAFIICALLSLAFMLSGLGFFTGNAFAAEQENSTFAGDKSTRLLLVLDDKLAAISESNGSISDIKIVYGFNGDTYVVVECNPIGYMIYHPDSGTFTETSPSSLSPYLGLYGDELYYCGPTRYYQFVENEFVHTVLGYAIDDDENIFAMINHSEYITDVLNTDKNEFLLDFIDNGNMSGLSFSSTASPSSSTTFSSSTVMGSIGNDGYDFYKNLTNCGYFTVTEGGKPYGQCGFIALNLLYAYLDKFMDDKYMPNGHWTSPLKTNLMDGSSSFSKVLRDLDPKNGTTSMHIHKVSKQYLKDEGITDIDHTSRWTPFWTKNTVASIIDDGYPVAIFGNLGGNTSPTEDKGYHAVTAYAYNRSTTGLKTVDSFIVHYGWNGFSEITVVDNMTNTFGSIYAMEITNGHIHNFVNTAKWTMDGSTLYGIEECTICGAEEPIDAYQTTNIGSTEIRIDTFLPESYTVSVTIPSILNGRTVTQIGNGAFQNSQLSQITIPASVSYLNSGVFNANTEVNWLNTSAFNTTTVSGGIRVNGFGVGYNTAQRGNIFIPNKINGKNVVAISTNAFADDASLYRISISSSVKEIGIGAFHGNTSGTWLENFDFSNGSTLTEFISSQTSYNISNFVTIIDARAFQNNSTLTQITIPATVVSIRTMAFSNCTNLGSVILQGKSTKVSSTAFYGCSKLPNWQNLSWLEIEFEPIPLEVSYSGYFVNGNTAVIYYTIKNYNPYAVTVKSGLAPDEFSAGMFYIFNYSRNLIIQANNSESVNFNINLLELQAYINMGGNLWITTAIDYITKDCEGFRQVSYAEALRTGPVSYSKVSNPNAVSIDEAGVITAVNGMVLGDINIPSTLKGRTITCIGSSAFANQNLLTHITIPNGITNIGLGAFQGCTSLQSIILPFVGNKLNETSDFHFGYIFGAIYASGQSDFIPLTLKEVIITGGNIIGGSAFLGCENITNILLPASVTSIGGYAFESCFGLLSIQFAANSMLKTIRDYAFFNCENLQSIIIPKSVTSIADDAFNSCYMLEGVSFEYGSRLESIGECAFIDCTSLENFSIPLTTKAISVFAFSYTAMWSNVPNDSIFYIEDWVVGYKGNISSDIVLKEGTRGIGEASLSSDSVINVVLPKSMEIVNARAFGIFTPENVIFNGIIYLDEFSFYESNRKFIVPYLSVEHYEQYLGVFYSSISYFTNSHTMTVNDYNFPQQYHFSNLDEKYYLPDFTLTTNRFRTGFIEKEYIVLSPKREGAGKAYLEYSFTRPVTFINVDLAMWSATEYDQKDTPTAVFEYKDSNGNWITKLDLFKDIKLPTDRSKPGNYTIVFDVPVTEFRFYTTGPATGTSNKGRLCIGSMNIYYV